MNYVVEGFRRFADFRGRTSRKGFWIFTVVGYLLIQLVAFVEGLLGFPIMDVPFLTIVFSFVMYVPLLAVGARRMHDIGKSGWYYLIPLYNLYLAAQPGEPAANKWGEVPPQD